MAEEKRKMYNVTLVINPDKFGALKQAFNELGICGMTVTHVEGCGTQMTHSGYYRGTPTDISLLPKTNGELAASHKHVKRVGDTDPKLH